MTDNAAEEKREFTIRPLENSDRNWVADFLDKHWSSTKIVSRGQVYYAHLLPGFVACNSEDPNDHLGLITYRVDGDQIEIMTLDSLKGGIGIGTALIDAVRAAAADSGIKRIWLIITNDNLNAMRFYQKRGYRLAALYPGELSEARKLKPQIPLIGHDDIPLHDEIELELSL